MREAIATAWMQNSGMAKEQAQAQPQISFETSWSRTVEIGSSKQPHVAEFPTVVWSRRPRVHWLALGHVSVQTTERYLGCKQRLRNAVNDRIGLEPANSWWPLGRALDRLRVPNLAPALLTMGDKPSTWIRKRYAVRRDLCARLVQL